MRANGSGQDGWMGQGGIGRDGVGRGRVGQDGGEWVLLDESG